MDTIVSFDKKEIMNDFINQVVQNHKYKKLSYMESTRCRNYYMDMLDPFWKNKDFLNYKIELRTKNDMIIANGVSSRGFVCGDYGVFLEIEDNQIAKENIKVKKGEEYRIDDPYYMNTVKYEWYTDKDNTNVKLYHQKRGVTYADYKPGKWYISPYEVMTVKIRKRVVSLMPCSDNSIILQQELFK